MHPVVYSSGKVVVSFEKQRNSMIEVIRQSCNDFLNEPDWEKNFVIVDRLNRMPYLCPFAMKEIRVLLKTKNPEIEILALTLIETIVKNCPSSHSAVSQPDFMRYLVKVALNQRKDGKIKSITKKLIIIIMYVWMVFESETYRLTFKKGAIDHQHKRSQCIDKAKLLLQMLGMAYKESHLYPIFKQTYHKLKSQGIRFPQPNKDEDLQLFAPMHSHINDTSNNSSKNNSAMGSIAKSAQMSHLPMITYFVPVENLFDSDLIAAQETAQILYEVVNNSEDGDRMLDNEIVSTLVITLETLKQKIIAKASDPSLNETILMQALQMNDVVNTVLMDVKCIQNGTKRRYREVTQLSHIFDADEESHDDNEGEHEIEFKQPQNNDIIISAPQEMNVCYVIFV